MTLGVGGSTMEAELGRMRSMREGVAPIGDDELRARVAKAQSIMRRECLQALHLDSSPSCLYFTRLRFALTERLHGVVILAEGDLTYVSLGFRSRKAAHDDAAPGEVRCWEEHDSPTALAIDVVRDMGYPSAPLRSIPRRRFSPSTVCVGPATLTASSMARPTAACRMIKSPAEIVPDQARMELTLEVHSGEVSASCARDHDDGGRRLHQPRACEARLGCRPQCQHRAGSASRPPTLMACPIRRH